MVVELDDPRTSGAESGPVSLPFVRYPSAVVRPASTDATPWGSSDTAPLAPSIEDHDSEGGTFVLAPETSASLLEPAVAAPISAAASQATERDAPEPRAPRNPNDLWRKPIEEPPVAAAPPPPKPAPAPNANLKSSLYKKFR
jgi:hypothetical protein